MNGPRSVDPPKIRLCRESDSSLSLTVIDDRTYLNVQILRAAPLSDPAHYISILDANAQEIAMINHPSELDDETRRVLYEELDRTYMTVAIWRINSARIESGVVHLNVETDRGWREFVLKDMHESVRRLGGNRLLLQDVDRNRFDIPDVGALDRRSAKLIEQIMSGLQLEA